MASSRSGAASVSGSSSPDLRERGLAGSAIAPPHLRRQVGGDDRGRPTVGGDVDSERGCLVRDAAFGGAAMDPRPPGIARWFAPRGQPLAHDLDRRAEAEVQDRSAGAAEARPDFIQECENPRRPSAR